MARPLDYEYRDNLLNLFKTTWLQHNKQPFKLTVQEIATQMGDNNKNKAFFYIGNLQRNGNIAIIDGGNGSKANIYDFIRDNAISAENKISEAREEMVGNVDNLINGLNNFSTQAIELFSNINRQNVSYLEEIEGLKLALSGLIYDGTDSNGCPRYKINQDSVLPMMLDQINKGQQAASTVE